MRGFGLHKAAGAGLICFMAAVAIAPVTQAIAQDAMPAPVSAAPAPGSTPAAPPSAVPTKPVAEPTKTAAAAPAPQPRVLNRASDAPQARTTRYSRSHKTTVGPAPAPAAAADGTPASGDIVCHAGCKQPGEVVYSPAAAVAQPAVQTAEAKAANPTHIQCVAGCYDGVTSIAATPAAAEATYMTTGAKLPHGKPASSGEWMVKINRERGR